MCPNHWARRWEGFPPSQTIGSSGFFLDTLLKMYAHTYLGGVGLPHNRAATVELSGHVQKGNHRCAGGNRIKNLHNCKK